MARTFSSLSAQNSHASSQTSASLSPTAGGVLLACTWGSTNNDPTLGGTLTGTWTKVQSFQTAAGIHLACYYNVGYGASGTVSASGLGVSGSALTVTQFVDAGVIDTLTVIKQSKTADNLAHPFTSNFASTPTYATFFCIQTGSGHATAGTGYTLLDDSIAWEQIGTLYSAAGAQAAGSSGADGNGIIQLELANLSTGNHTGGSIPFVGWTPNG